MINAISVDVEDYYMVSAFEGTIKFSDWGSLESRVDHSTNLVLDLLDGYRVKATFFVLGWIAEQNKKLVKEIKNRGHEIASHGHSHRLACAQSRKEFREDIRRSKAAIEDACGSSVIGYRAPSFSITKQFMWPLDILIEEGFRYDSSIFPIRHDRYGYPEFSRFPVTMRREPGHILEIPPSTARVFEKNLPIAGGGYLRLFPVRLIKWGINALNRTGRPGLIYFHPWELDANQPAVKASPLASFRHRVNIGKMEYKLRDLLGSFNFAPIEKAFSAELSFQGISNGQELPAASN